MALTALVDARLVALVPAMWLTSVAFGLVGLGVAAHFMDFFRFLFAATRLQGLLQLPALAIIGLVSRWWFMWLPSAPALYALQLVVQRGPRVFLSPAYWAYLLLLAGWAVVALVWTEQQYLRRVRGVPGGGRRGGAGRGGRNA